MKILLVNHSDTSGGAARAAFRLHQALLKKGVDSRMLVKEKRSDDDRVITLDQFTPRNPFYKSFRFFREKIYNRWERLQWSRYPERDKVFLSGMRSVPFHKALQKIDYDILHVHWVNLRYMDLKELQKVKKPVVWTLHDCWPFTGICHYFYDCRKFENECGNCPFLHSGKENDLSRQVWKKKQKIFSQSKITIITPSSWLGMEAGKSRLFNNMMINVIPNGIDTSLFRPGDVVAAREHWNLDLHKKIILFIAMNGIDDPRKGFHLLRFSLKEVTAKTNDRDMELMILGSSLRINSEDIPLTCHYKGVFDDDNELVLAYQACDVVVVPSISENLSNVIMEAMSCGTPVVGFDLGGNSELIEHKSNGFLAEPLNTQSLAEGIIWCLQNNSDRNLSNNARQKVLTNYSDFLVSKQHIQQYEMLLSR